MVEFLLKRPISVLMAFLACFIVGVVAYFTLPVSLLPNIAIPQITIQVEGENVSARELENTRMAPLRRAMLQLSGLDEMRSETRDGSGIIHLSFNFGTRTDLAFVEVNEKIDGVMNTLPKDAVRPKAIKASATDIPVFYLNMTLKNDSAFQKTDEQSFLKLGELAENVIRRRIEQLPQVAMADVTGIPKRMVQLIPDMNRLQSLGLTIADLENVLKSNNVEPGSMLVRDGYYEYNIRIASLLRTPEDVENIYLQKNGHILQLKDICQVKEVAQKEMGRSLADGKRAVTLAIIKQSEENMDGLKEGLQETLDYFSEIYPEIAFSISRNQTELLDYTISNLKQNFMLGFVLIFIVAILFIGDFRSPVVIGISMVTSVVITFFLFYLCKVSMNVISLSGLILAVGMMIDNAIIVTENIEQWRAKGLTLRKAAARGTTEMITPMLSSSLTTIAVFVPLVFMSGIAGAIFMDQAFSISTGLLTSYLTGIMLLPVLYLLAYRMGMKNRKPAGKHHWVNNTQIEGWYEKGINWVFAHRKLSMLTGALTIPLCVVLFFVLEIARMPEIDQNELVMKVDWNENIHVTENSNRVNTVLKQVSGEVKEHTAYVGLQDFVLGSEESQGTTEAELYFKTEKPEQIAPLQQQLTAYMKQNYPQTRVSFAPPVTIFEKLFVTGEPDVVAQLQKTQKQIAPTPEEIMQIEAETERVSGIAPEGIAFKKQINLNIDRNKLLLYGVEYDEVSRMLRTAFQEGQATTLRSYQQYLPVSITSQDKTVEQVLRETLVQNNPQQKADGTQGTLAYVPLQSLVSAQQSLDLKTIEAGKNGEYVPLRFYDVKDAPGLMSQIREVVRKAGGWDLMFSGSYFQSRKMMGELIVILLISVLLMYFILCAQFESFLQPLIVLAEIPMDTAFALLCLLVFGHTLNLMSAIGIIVACGIVVNDSILKIDSINELRKQGVPLLEAIHTAGRRRLRAIVMTTLTTVFAMLPMLFTSDMGSELQRPLAIAMIGAMLVGMFISMFYVPLVYWMIYKKKSR